RSRPAATMSSVDLPEPDGPTRPTASPAPIFTPMSLRICTRAAPRPSERLTPESEIAERGATEVSFMRSVLRLFGRTCPRSYGKTGGAVQTGRIVARALAGALALSYALALSGPAGAADQPVRIVALGDSLTAGLGLARTDAFPAKLEAALRARGIAVTS